MIYLYIWDFFPGYGIRVPGGCPYILHARSNVGPRAEDYHHRGWLTQTREFISFSTDATSGIVVSGLVSFICVQYSCMYARVDKRMG